MNVDRSLLATDIIPSIPTNLASPRKNPPPYRFLRDPKQSDEIGRLGDYRILRLLGQGGTAYVFLAEDIFLKRRVALKVMKPSFNHDDPSAYERFLHEAQTLASIKHDRVVSVYQVSQDADVIFLAMECLQGEALDDWFLRNGPPSALKIVQLACDIAIGLDVIHSRGLIHRDLKPNNLWVEEPNGRVKLLDFGLVRSLEDDKHFTASGFIVGTPAFMSPEQARGEQIDARSDLFSLGGILYYLSTGRLPFSSNSSVGTLTAVVMDHPTPISDLNTRLPKPLTKLIMQLLEKKPENRPASAKELVARLNELKKLIAVSYDTDPNTGEAPKTQSIDLQDQTCKTELQESFTGQEKKAQQKRRKGLLLAAGLTFGVAFLLSSGLNSGLGLPLKLSAQAGSDFPAVAQNYTLGNDNLGSDIPVSDADKQKKIQEEVLQRIGSKNPVVPEQKQLDTKNPIIQEAPKRRGILVLDDCDKASSDKQIFNDNLTLLNSDGEKVFRISGFNTCDTMSSTRSIVSDSRRNAFWVLENANNRLRRFDHAGQVNVTLQNIKGSAFAIDPETGNIWTLVDHQQVGSGVLVVYDPTGNQLMKKPMSGWDIVYDSKTKSFWIASCALTQVDAASHKTIRSVNIRGYAMTLDLDRKNGGVWVGARIMLEEPGQCGQLLRYDAEGQEVVKIDLGKSIPIKVSVDPKDGSVWVAKRQNGLEHYSADGKLLNSYPIHALAVVVDPEGDLWVATDLEVQKMGRDGTVKKSIRHASSTNQIWMGILE